MRRIAGGVERLVLGALVGTVAGIHLDLWASYGYDHIPTIGVLFLLNGIFGGLLAVAMMASPRRLLWVPAVSAIGYAITTLVALLISLNGGLFGFTERASAPLLGPAVGTEAATVVVAGLVAARSLLRVRSSRRAT